MLNFFYKREQIQASTLNQYFLAQTKRTLLTLTLLTSQKYTLLLLRYSAQVQELMQTTLNGWSNRITEWEKHGYLHTLLMY